MDYLDELDFERKAYTTDSYDYYNDHKNLTLEDIDYDKFEGDYGKEQYEDVLKEIL